MFFKFRASIIAGAVALALGGTAMANTTLDTTAGDVFINVVDTNNNTSFLFDTGVSQAAFNGAGGYSFTLTGDANYQAFVAGEGAGDIIDYSVVSATRTTTSPAVGTILFTSNANPAVVTGQHLSSGVSFVNAFAGQANGVSSGTANSVLLGSANTWGQVAYEQSVASNLGVQFTGPGSGVDALVGTALNFYEETSNALTSARSTATVLTAFAGTWNLVDGVATYTSQAAPVPLPTPVLLLLSGLGLMGAVARRGKGAVPAV